MPERRRRRGSIVVVVIYYYNNKKIMDIVTPVITVKPVSTLDIGVDIDVNGTPIHFFRNLLEKDWVFKAQGLMATTKDKGDGKNENERL